MAVGDRKNFSKQLVALLLGATLCSYFENAPLAYGQENNTGMPAIGQNISPDAKLMLSANELVYNKDQELVSVIGGVQINYGGYKLVAQKVDYNQKTGRMMATGNIEMVTPDGNRIYADHLDVTDNFADGFMNALRIETSDNTRLVAETGQRVGGTQMILNKGVYTACLPCAEKPERAPFWQVKAERVIQNSEKHTIRLEHARFQLLGRSLAYLPWIEVPDNTVKRKSGFLFPSMSVSQNLGYGLSVPYYYVISPSSDFTVTGTGYTSQGLMLEGEYRRRFENGTVTMHVAGIDQMNPSNFSEGTSDAEAKQRGMVASAGRFRINPRWSFGWDVMVQSDNNFSRTYKIDGYDDTPHANTVFLTGLGKRNYFDLRAFYFDVQDADRNNTAEKQQAIVYPTLDYHYVAPQPLAGGELSADVNLTNISRTHDDFYNVAGFDRFRGLEGQTTRLSTELQWKRTFVTSTGLVITPLLAARGDAFALNMESPVDANGIPYAGNYLNDSAATRGMITAGLEMRYPILFTTSNSTHVLEPIAQVYARPDEPLAGRLPNEDAQSFVFDATNLFDRDRFSGYDRIEGGTRANLGFQYTGTFDSGYKLRGIFGQSYQLAGQNSFATDDLVNVGADSGLETDRSDYVGLGGIEMPFGLSMAASYRLDEKDFSFNRGDLITAYQNDTFSGQVTYTHVSAQPAYGFADDQDEIQASSRIKFKDYWSIFGGIAWDLNNDVVTRRTLGISYEDECTIFTIAYTDARDTADQTASDWTIAARLTFRTLGDIRLGTGDAANNL